VQLSDNILVLSLACNVIHLPVNYNLEKRADWEREVNELSVRTTLLQCGIVLPRTVSSVKLGMVSVFPKSPTLFGHPSNHVQWLEDDRKE
jgi:hypothetical protein